MFGMGWWGRPSVFKRRASGNWTSKAREWKGTTTPARTMSSSHSAFGLESPAGTILEEPTGEVHRFWIGGKKPAANFVCLGFGGRKGPLNEERKGFDSMGGTARAESWCRGRRAASSEETLPGEPGASRSVDCLKELFVCGGSTTYSGQMQMGASVLYLEATGHLASSRKLWSRHVSTFGITLVLIPLPANGELFSCWPVLRQGPKGLRVASPFFPRILLSKDPSF